MKLKGGFQPQNHPLHTPLSESDCVCEGWAVLTWQRNNETVELLRNNSIVRAIT